MHDELRAECPTCGGPKDFHTEELWKAHNDMYKDCKEMQRSIKKQARRARKKKYANKKRRISSDQPSS